MTSRKNTNDYQENQNVQQILNHSESFKTSSMTTLILWNVNKALEKNPALELKSALKNAQESLEKEEVNVSAIATQRPDERHLSCAMLAWQQLGHSHADSLYSFVVAQMNQQKAEKVESKLQPKPFGPFQRVNNDMPFEKSFITHKESDLLNSPAGSSFVSNNVMGPVLKLPVTPKVVIPVYNMQGCCGIRKTGQDIKNRIEKACVLESDCLKKLVNLDKQTKELRLRLGKLAKREAQRIELLERAETAWRDLEMGYMRRLRTCVEKEEDLSRQSTKMIAERNDNKEACAKLVKILKPRGEMAEQAQASLQKLEADVCARACERLKMSELAAKEDAVLVQLQCQSNRQDRDLLFKEEQARRKKMSVENDLESIRGLTYETERAIKAELKAFKEQMKSVADELFAEDELIEKHKLDRDALLEEKKELIEDLEGCQEKCDANMESQCDVLKGKREKLHSLKDRAIECKCKFPMEMAVQVTRTPSLAALCYCAPEDRAKKSCSCTSIRTRLLSDLFETLFDGLQYEMADSSLKMPCQLLKCLEDKHNWDKASVTKTNLRSFFAKMLCGELDIAIINSIEKYHARWVGTSCADMGRPIPDFDDPDIESWQDRALAQKAHWMAEAMAEQMFQEKVDDIMEQAQKVVSGAPPPCKCKPPPNENDTAVYQCFVEPVGPSFTLSDIPPSVYLPEQSQPERQLSPYKISPECNTTINNALVSATTNTPKKKPKEAKGIPKSQKDSSENSRAQWLCKNDVMILKAEVEDLKKGSIKKQDLKLIEQTIRKLVQRASGPDFPEKLRSFKENDSKNERRITENKNMKHNGVKSTSLKRKRVESKFKRNYEVNMCFCGVPNNSSSKSGKQKPHENTNDSSIVFNLNKNSSTKSDKYKPEEVVDSSKAIFELNKNSLTLSEKQNLDVMSNCSNLSKYNKSDKNCFEDEISQNSTVRQSKPITQLPSEEKKDLKKNKTCGSECACFNKIPSSTSIDKLLEQLIKWKSDLSAQPGISDKVESDMTFKKTADDMSSKIRDMSAIVCQSIVIKGIPNETCELNSLVKKASQVAKDENFKGNFVLPATVSEYMGAVNLEKSNENFCKCVLNKEKCKESFYSRASKDIKKSKKDVQTSSFSKSKSKVSVAKKVDSFNQKKVKSEEYKQKNEECSNQRKIKSQEFYNLTKMRDIKENISLSNKICVNKLSPSFKSITQDKKQPEKSKPVPSLFVDESYKQLKEHDSINCDFDLKEQSDRSLISPGDVSCGCDYQIKLLGVTLDNVNTSKNKINKFREQTSEALKSHLKQAKYQSQRAKSHEDSISNCYPLKSMEHYDLFQNYKTDVSDLDPICQCGEKIDKIKDLLENIYKNKGDAKEDKALDTAKLLKNSSNLKNGLNDEHCVCCVNSADESNELEVNTFQLLQEHLKKKLEHLKDTCQSSYCIKPDEEDKVLAEIFKKIKQTITDSTGKFACKCSEQVNSTGSWQRAYNLLQEYLKIKISRVQCSCSLPGQNNTQTILPELTDKVCLLIEKDFERLKNICKCRSNKKSDSNRSSLDEEIAFQVPEKDIDKNKKYDVIESKSLKKGSIIKELSSKSYIITTNNISAQVIPNFETKSCEAIKDSDSIKNTVETQSSNNEYSLLKNSCSIDCKLFDAVKNLSNHSTQYSRGNDHELEPYPTKSEDIFKKFKELEVELKKKYNPIENSNSTSLPYIGYTIDCSGTPNLGSSVCPRAMINKNSKAIDEFWSTYTKSKTNNEKFSYLMGTLHKNDVDLPRTCNVSKKSMLKTAAQQVATTNTKTNTYKAGVITLKDSREYLNKQSCHGGTNTEDNDLLHSSETDITSVESWDAPKYESEDCTYILETPKKKSVHFLHRSKNEVVATESFKDSESFSQDCNCSKVPVCHVKMLVENIENKLANSECTCDSLSSKVCPVHSKIILA